MNSLQALRDAFETAYIDAGFGSTSAYKPEFVYNNSKEGRTVLSAIEDELLRCDQFQISVAFITMGGVTPLLQTLKELERRKIPGQVLTTNYLNFSEPRALEKLNELKNIEIKMYDVDGSSSEGFHTKGYLFRQEEIYRIIIGSSNMTSAALKLSQEWNTKLVSTAEGEMAAEIVTEFNRLWSSPQALQFDEFYNIYKQRYEIIKHQREIAKAEEVVQVEKYRLEPNSMQVGFINNLKAIIAQKQDRALLISATGTGKTFASAFAMRELGFERVLFLVHRSQLASQTLRSYKRVFSNKVSMGLVGDGKSEFEADYVFATVQTLNRDEHLHKYQPEDFDCIILDEAHHSAANTYQKVMSYFKPKLWLGMTATPDKRDDAAADRNIYEIFNHQIAYEIRLQQAMEDDLLCPFHYFGVSELALVDEKEIAKRKIDEQDFRRLTSDERVRHIIENAEYYGYSGDRVKGLVFCSRIDESEELSSKFNALGYRTIALNGSASEAERAAAFERLAMDEADATEDFQPLDYIFSVEILNEGVDIVEVNQVIMLRPTQSPIVFIQQLGRGLRKAEGKEYVVIIDFIGNYTNNFMIPIALSGDRSYNADTIRRYVISGNNTIPGASTIHFDEVSKEKIFASIDKMKGVKALIKNSYNNLKNRLGRRPYLVDFYEQGEVDPLLIIQEYKTYQGMIKAADANSASAIAQFSPEEETILRYLSKTVLSGVRPYEIEILSQLLEKDEISVDSLQKDFVSEYGYAISDENLMNAISVLKGEFVVNNDELEEFSQIDVMSFDAAGTVRRMLPFAKKLSHAEFKRQVRDLLEVARKRYWDKYHKNNFDNSPFALYEKYSRRDVSLLMNCGKDESSTMFGMRRFNDDVFLFVTYHKEKAAEGMQYNEGKPDYADAFEDNQIFRWDSQIGRGVDSSYMNNVTGAERKHLFVKKSNKERGFYYLGQFDIMNVEQAKKLDNNGKQQDIAKVQMKMQIPVREDLLRYFQSEIKDEEATA